MKAWFLSPRDCLHSPLCGGKARDLARLSQEGLPVPDWGLISTQAFAAWLQHQGIHSADLERAWEDGPEAWSALIPDTANTDWLQALLRSFLDDWPHALPAALALRSSSSWEDQHEHAFAGAFHSAIGIASSDLEALAQGLFQVWRSPFCPAIWHLAQGLGLELKSLGLAVIVQHSIKAESAGVWFQVNPRGNFSESVLVAGQGAGQGVVDNQTPTQSWFWDQMGEIWRGPLREEVETPIDTHSPSELLQLTERNALKTLFERVQAARERAQDIEWCLDTEGKAWILQSRDITGLNLDRALFLDAHNLNESYPGVISPLSFSVVQRGYAVNMRSALALAGLSPAELAALDNTLQQLVLQLGGRMFYHRAHWQEILALLPGASQMGSRAFQELIGSQAPRLQSVSAQPLWKVLPRLIYALWWLSRHQEDYKQEVQERLSAFRRDTEAAQSASDLIALRDGHFEALVSRFALGLLNDLWLGLCLHLGKAWTKRWLTQSGEELDWPGLLSGVRDLPSYTPLLQVLQIAQQLTPQEQAQLQAQLNAQPNSHRQVWDRLRQDAPPWFQALAQYRRDYGFRVPQEFLLEQNSFYEQPDALLRWLVQQRPQQARELQQNQQAQEQRARELIQQLPRLQRPVLRWLIRRIHQAMRRREQVRLFRAASMAAARRFYLRLGEFLVQAGCLTQAREVLWFSEAECDALVEALDQRLNSEQHQHHLESLAQNCRDHVQRRQEEHQHWNNCELPLKLLCAPDYQPQPRHFARPQIQQQSWQGLGCSGKQVQAEALVCHQPPSPETVRDKILVVRATDPGWMLALLHCKGLIAEQGNLLSHAAILGRELNLPTVVGITGATALISSGQWLKLDGRSGRVELRAAPETLN